MSAGYSCHIHQFGYSRLCTVTVQCIILMYVWVTSVGLNMSAELIIVGSAMPVDITTLYLISEQEVLQTISIVNSTSDSIVAMFMPPEEEFKLQAIGMDDRGYNFSYISDVSVEPTSISLNFGK